MLTPGTLGPAAYDCAYVSVSLWADESLTILLQAGRDGCVCVCVFVCVCICLCDIIH